MNGLFKDSELKDSIKNSVQKIEENNKPSQKKDLNSPDFIAELIGELKKIENSFSKIREVLENTITNEELHKPFVSATSNILLSRTREEQKKPPEIEKKEKTIPEVEFEVEGVFDGEKMISEDGSAYRISENYCSKSKLVEGDLLKYVKTKDGKFFFKQVGPVYRKRIVGKLVENKDRKGNFTAISYGKTFKVLRAAVNQLKGVDGDEVILLIPREGISEHAAIDVILHSPL
jgi:hypothetical protein